MSLPDSFTYRWHTTVWVNAIWSAECIIHLLPHAPRLRPGVGRCDWEEGSNRKVTSLIPARSIATKRNETSARAGCYIITRKWRCLTSLTSYSFPVKQPYDTEEKINKDLAPRLSPALFIETLFTSFAISFLESTLYRCAASGPLIDETNFVDIDECAPDSGNALCNQICLNEIGTHSCDCYKGYELAADNFTCNGMLDTFQNGLTNQSYEALRPLWEKHPAFVSVISAHSLLSCYICYSSRHK